ncbi:hypothetical protein K469DRAFT_44167 [Zopfia rhizophila CBS 207.26]|uniref:Ubiquitin-like domain-containing protein n=1 Tax=Zopfia rhizophila CBS 207.26 TaxID=1314779 RepID=A0A6A6EG53_9PEZI|nr:hypothetical protein K469DRAFT_44167 [Zopfia rhizophila CBS 207.26]
MGCCFSRQAQTDNSPYPAPVTNAATAPDSLRNITATSPVHPASLSTPRESQHSHARHASHSDFSQAKSVAPNTPLKPLNPSRRCALPTTLNSPATRRARHHVVPLSQPAEAAWTRKRLKRERQDFWDTRTTGRPETWAALRLMVEMLQEGHTGEAQGFLDACGCTCPNGEVWRGVFDDHGEWYKIPEWIVVEPSGLVEVDEEEEDGKSYSEDEIEELKVEKGKGKAVVVEEVVGPAYKVKCRLSNTGQDVVIKVGREEKLGMLVRRLRASTGMYDQKIKVAYLGRILHEHETLESQGWREGHVLNFLVFG